MEPFGTRVWGGEFSEMIARGNYKLLAFVGTLDDVLEGISHHLRTIARLGDCPGGFSKMKKLTKAKRKELLKLCLN